MQSRKLLADITAGLTVSFAAISLGAAFGVMSGRGAFAGMTGAAVIPIITSLLGGARLQASGPTAPMTAVSALLIAFAYDKFPEKVLAEQFITLVFILTGVLQIIAGIIRLGKWISYVPNVVILGFMNGIAVLIWWDQFTKILALKGQPVMEGGILLNLVLTIVTFALIFVIMWLPKKLNAPHHIRSLISGVLWSIIVMTVLTLLFGISVKKVELGATISSLDEFTSMVANYFPKDVFQVEYILAALPYALELTLLGYLDSLLTTLILDRILREKSKLNKELIAQGLANGIVGIFQGIPGAQATIRSVLLIKEGAQTRLAGVMVGVFALLSIVLLKDLLILVPAAVFSGVLLKAGLDVSDKDFPRYYIHYRWYRNRDRNIQLLFVLYTTVVTVLIDLNIAVISGTILYYTARYFWKINDIESDFADVDEEVLAGDQKLNK